MDHLDLSSVAQLGEFFALPLADDNSWLPITSLLTDTATVQEYAMRARSAIASGMSVEETLVPFKAAASSVHLSIAARLLSPAVGAAVCLSAVPLLTAESVFWQRTSSHRPVLGAARIEWVQVTGPRQAAGVIAESLIRTVLDELNETMRQATSLSPQVMWGNIASAANGAVTVLSQSQPSAKPRGQALVRALIAAEPLTEAADIVNGQFRRQNCCLFYLVPGGGYCGDCVLVD